MILLGCVIWVWANVGFGGYMFYSIPLLSFIHVYIICLYQWEGLSHTVLYIMENKNVCSQQSQFALVSYWLVVLTSLKNMKVSWDDYSQYIWKIEKCSKPPTSLYHVDIMEVFVSTWQKQPLLGSPRRRWLGPWGTTAWTREIEFCHRMRKWCRMM